MDLAVLKRFLHVAELGSLSRAAERLDASQPALSRQLRQLEQTLGCRLLERTGRGVRLTAAGQILERHARVLLDQAGELRAELAQETALVQGRVTLALPPSVGAALTVPLVTAYRSAHPRVALQMVEDMTGAIEEGLLGGRLDLAVLYDGATSVNLCTEPLGRESLWLVAPQGAGLPRSLPLRAALERTLILPRERHALRAILQRYAAQAGCPLRVEIEVDSLRAQIELVQRGLGCSILPAAALRTLEPAQLEVVRVTAPVLERMWVLAWSRAHPLSRAARAMAELLRERIGELAELHAWNAAGPTVPSGRPG